MDLLNIINIMSSYSSFHKINSLMIRIVFLTGYQKRHCYNRDYLCPISNKRIEKILSLSYIVDILKAFYRWRLTP